MINIYYIVCEATGEEDALEGESKQEVIEDFARKHKIDRWDDEETYLSIKATVLYK